MFGSRPFTFRPRLDVVEVDPVCFYQRATCSHFPSLLDLKGRLSDLV
jgi:hypothetical protein